MNVELAIAGVGWFFLAFGHTMVGVRWVLPRLWDARLPSTPFGPPSFTLGMLRFTWHIVTVMLLGFGVLFMALAFAPHADTRTLLLRWVAAVQLVAAGLSAWQARRRLSSMLRIPVALVFVVIAALCLVASA